jgi:hypothetical protein
MIAVALTRLTRLFSEDLRGYDIADLPLQALGHLPAGKRRRPDEVDVPGNESLVPHANMVTIMLVPYNAADA